MSDDFQALEAALAGLRPAVLDRGLLARLEAGATGGLTTSSPAEVALETSLRGSRAAAIPPALMAALEAALTASAAAEGSRIVAFPQSPAAGGLHHRSHRPMWVAAAAVAMLGAAAALFLPNQGARPTAAAPASHPPPTSLATTAPAAPASQNFVPAAFNTSLSQASDVGVLWQEQNQAQRVVKVIYWDRVTLVNPEGKQIEYETPRVEYILVPEKID
ncbi:MAG: hypothetical protein DVB25_05210 [Verrucomicrobia bacterium]|nr:MAG: hypothetical protein DVB25_05210 [Verrucomicrobiota bacterium]